MPKARQTCTRCSMRRQKCDRKAPCTRCVRSGQAGTCSREWPDGYDPKIHRTYPRGEKLVHLNSQQSGDAQENDLDLDLDLETTSHTGTTNIADLSGSGVGAVPKPSYNAGSSDRSNENLHEFSTNGILPSLGVEEQRRYLQSLIPNAQQVFQLVDYHNSHILWYHGSIHGPSFRKETAAFLAAQTADNNLVDVSDFRWLALLFSVLAASICSASGSLLQTWGISKDQKHLLGRKWYQGALLCLHLGDYTLKSHFFSVQAIYILSFSAHPLGFSNNQFVNSGAALKIAQSIGLQRLVNDPELDTPPGAESQISQPRKNLLIKRETGRRVWYQLCAQDWFATWTSDMYSINKHHFTTAKPQRLDEDTLRPVGEDVLLETDFRSLVYDIASSMAEFHDSITSSTDPEEKYNQVLKYDQRLRGIAGAPTAQAFVSEQNINKRPRWCKWAKTLFNIIVAHKILGVHRSFLGKSFQDPKFTYSKWASLEASKAILEELELASVDQERPCFWIEQAYLVSVGITFCLDRLHRSPTDPESIQMRKHIDRVISLLSCYDGCLLASRGTRIVTSLLGEGDVHPTFRSRHIAKEKEQFRSQEDYNLNEWPLEDRRGIDTLRTIVSNHSASRGQPKTPSQDARPSTRRPDAHRDIDSLTDNVHQGPAPGVNDIPEPSGTVMPQEREHLISSENGMIQDNRNWNVVGSTGGEIPMPADTNTMFAAVADISWMDSFLDLDMPAESGVHNAALMEDWFGVGRLQ